MPRCAPTSGGCARPCPAAALWAVVKADAYGHGAAHRRRDRARGGGRARCASRPSGRGPRCGRRFPSARIVVLGPTVRASSTARAREARLELIVAERPASGGDPAPRQGRHGHGPLGARRARSPSSPDVVGLMSHLASADVDPAFTELADRALRRDRGAAPRPHAPPREQRRHPALPGRSLRRRPARDRALRALARSAPIPADDGLAPGALVAELGRGRSSSSRPGESTGYQRRFVAAEPTWIGIVPGRVRGRLPPRLTGIEVLVGGRALPGRRHRLDGLLRGASSRRRSSRGHP